MDRRANTTMRQALFLAVLLLFMPLSGCLSDENSSDDEDMNGFYPSVWERHELDWNWTSSISYVLEPGPYEALEVQEATFEVDTSGVWETGPAT